MSSFSRDGRLLSPMKVELPDATDRVSAEEFTAAFSAAVAVQAQYPVFREEVRQEKFQNQAAELYALLSGEEQE